MKHFSVIMFALAAFLLAAFTPVASQGISVRPFQYVASNPAGSCTNTQANQYDYVDNTEWGCNNGTWTQVNGSGGGGVPSSRSISTTSPLGGGGDLSTNRTFTCTTCTVTVCSGTVALGTGAISSGAKASTVTGTCTGLLSTDNFLADFNADPTGVTGYSPTVNGTLTIVKFPTADTVNFVVMNNTGSSITPGAITLNYRAVR